MVGRRLWLDIRPHTIGTMSGGRQGRGSTRTCILTRAGTTRCDAPSSLLELVLRTFAAYGSATAMW